MFWDMVGKSSHSSMINCHSSFGANWLALPSLAHADITNQSQLPFLLSLYSTPESFTTLGSMQSLINPNRHMRARLLQSLNLK